MGAAVDVVRDLYAAHNEGDARAATLWADDAEMVVPSDDFLLGGHFRGREAILQWFADWFGSFERGVRFDMREITALDDGQVLAVSDQRGRGRASGLEVDLRVVWLYRVRDGKIARAQLFASREKALEATGEPG